VAGYLALGDYAAGLKGAQHLLQLDPLREEAHRQLMRLLAYSGQRNAALIQYETCCQILADELGVEPMAATVTLYEQIRSGGLSRGVGGPGGRKAGEIVEDPGPVLSKAEGSEAYRAPRLNQDWGEAPDTAAFYGRGTELARLERWLVRDRCRLVAVLGMGGLGKTA
ncbi:MAG: hypothetical protein GWN58_00015, partial [Anaerolineae bacterium]|nr:hypothetical protein [Anaerolineae bacterium]